MSDGCCKIGKVCSGGLGSNDEEEEVSGFGSSSGSSGGKSSGSSSGTGGSSSGSQSTRSAGGRVSVPVGGLLGLGVVAMMM